jgi:hypothetical protein
MLNGKIIGMFISPHILLYYFVLISLYLTGRTLSSITGRLYLMLGFRENRIKIIANFGQEDFQFKALDTFS